MENKLEIDKIKQTILLAAKREKMKLSEQHPSTMIRMEIWTRSNGNNLNKRYVFKIVGKEFEAEDCSLNAVRKVSKALKDCCTLLNEKRGYMVVEMQTPFYYQGRDVFGSVTMSETITNGLLLLNKPCKEFTTLQKYLMRHAQFTLHEADLYSVSVTGKRGTNYRESEQRQYYAHDPEKCKNILAWLGKNRKSGDTITAVVEEVRYCSDEDYSREYETESYGTFYRFLHIRLTDKKNREKTTIKTLYF